MKQTNSSRHLFFSLIFGAILVTSLMVYANFDDNDYELAIDEKRYADALTILKNKPEEKRTIPEKELLTSLDVVIQINTMEWPKNSMAMKEDEMDPEVIKVVNKYMDAVIKNYLAGKSNVSKKILLQVLFVYPDYPKARAFLSMGLNMPPGSYKVDDQVLKLLKKVTTIFMAVII